MKLDFGSNFKIWAAAVLWLLVVNPIQGLHALSGVARLSGPLRGCQTVVTFNNTATGNFTTDGNGSFDVTAGQRPDDVFGVVIHTGTSCLDIFTNLTLPFQLSAALPANASAGSVGYGSFTGLSYLELMMAANTTTNSMATLSNITTVRQSMSDLYGTFNISLVAFGLDPIQLQPLSLVQSANATTRALAIALLAADVEMGALAALGAALLNASSSAASGAAAANGSPFTAANMTTFARVVAAEGAWQLMQLEAQRQALLADQAAAAAAANATAAAAANSTVGSGDPSPPLPPSPPPSPSAAAVGGLYSTEVVAAVLEAAAQRMNVTVLPYALNATAAVVAGIAAFAEVVLDAALLEVGGLRLGLNPLNALITLTRLAAVQADAAAQMPVLVGPSPQALQTYMLDALPERISKETVNVTAIHLVLGLPAPAAPVAANGTVHVVGPLGGCMGQATGAWDPSYEAFETSSGSGALSLAAKGQGAVTVTPYRKCQDAITRLELDMSISNLGPAMSAVSVSPVAMLAQGFYTLQASGQLATISLAQQTAAFAALGLNLTAYNAFMIPPPYSSSSSSSVPMATATNTSLSFNLSHPLMGSVMAANVQLLGVMYASRALFATSCYFAYDMDSTESANTFTGTLTLYAAALQATTSGGVLNLTRGEQLEGIFAFVAKACYFNSSLAFGTTGSATTQTSTGTFLTGGSASSIGATMSGRQRRSALAAAHTDADADADAGVDLLASGSFLTVGPALHRCLRAELFAAGVTGPEALRWQRAVDSDPYRWGASGGWGAGVWAVRAAAGSGGRDGAVAARRLATGSRSAQAAGAVAVPRSLAVYVDDPDIVIVYSKVSEILSGINTKLQAVQAKSNAAAAAAAAQSPPSSSPTYNLTDLVTTAAQLGYVVQKSLYGELARAMSGTYSSGLTLVVAVQSIAANYSGAALLQRMADAPINTGLICSAQGAQCASSPSPPPSPPGSGGGGKKSNTALYAGVGVGVGLGIVALLLGAWAVRRAMRNRQVKQAVVNNLKAGDMHNMALRLPSAVPPEGQYGGAGTRQGQGQGTYQSLVPAALGSDPTVALDYPLYPVPALNASSNVYYQNHPQHYHNNGTMESTAKTAGGGGGAVVTLPKGGGGGGGDGGAAPLNMSLPPPRFPPPPLPPDRGSNAQGHAASVSLPMPMPHPQLLPPQQYPQRPASTPSQRLVPLNNGADGSYKTYDNSTYVSADGGGGSDAAAQRDNRSGTGGSGSWASNHRLLGSVPQQQQQQQCEAAGLPLSVPRGAASGGAAGGKPTWQNASLGAPPRALAAPGGPHGAGDGAAAAALLNGTLGARRTGLPPLAQYTHVTNTAAPTAALNASLRTIPVNTNFNSSLRPPPRSASQSGKPSER